MPAAEQGLCAKGCQSEAGYSATPLLPDRACILLSMTLVALSSTVLLLPAFGSNDSLAPLFFGSNLSVTAWQPGGGGAVAAPLSPAGGAGEYCCVPPPLRSRIGRYSEWLLLDVKG